MNLDAFDTACTLLPDELTTALRPYRRAEELRLRLGQPPTALLGGRELPFSATPLRQEDLRRVLEIASGASLHTAAPSLAGGFLSYRGLRIGVCGEAAISGGCLLGFRRLHALAVRIPQPCSRACLETASQALAEGPLNTLISAPPGVGKTSLLRELIRAASGRGYRVGVIDERKELAGDEENESLGPCSDVLSGLDKARAAMILLRGMNPQIIAMDEITRSGDAETVKDITGCGVAIFATAHGSSPEDMRGRRLYRELLDGGLFQQLICISLRAGERVYDRRLL